MSEKKNGLLKSDYVVRFDPATSSISFFTVSSATGAPSATPIRELDWTPQAGLTEVIDVGATICAHLLSRHSDAFCTADGWERIAEEIRVATGRDGEE